ncbi:MAG: hypothetical protein AAF447_23515 [Myxococcota bacterium]
MRDATAPGATSQTPTPSDDDATVEPGEPPPAPGPYGDTPPDELPPVEEDAGDDDDAAPATVQPAAQPIVGATPDAPAQTPVDGVPRQPTPPVPRDVPPPPGAAPGVVAVPTPAGGRRTAPNDVRVNRDSRGWTLRVDGEDLLVRGMNWDYFPIGTNYDYSLWSQNDEFIQQALDYEMSLMQEMGVNAIRVYVGIPAKWISYIYENYGIFTVLNHPMGRYGHNIDGAYIAPTNYADARTREVLLEEWRETVAGYKDTPGLLMWLLGNENNYGLYWSSNEIEDLPEATQGDARAVFLYSLMGEAVDAAHEIDTGHPVALANGDLGFIELIKEHCPNLDIMGSNVYRGRSSRDLFQRVADELDLPFFYTEFGSDAYNAREGREDDLAQADINLALWQEVYEHTAGHGRANNAIGGLHFQWSDGWWKYRQTENLDVHDETASWANDAYPFDFVEGENNMNEEWFGVCAKGQTNNQGFFRLYCRTSYYALRDGWALDPYSPNTDMSRIRTHFGNVRPRSLEANYAAQSAAREIESMRMIRTAFLRMDLETYVTGGRNLNVPERAQTRFDDLESFYFGFELQPAPRFRANLSVNVLGGSPLNPIDELFFEARGQAREVVDAEGETFAASGAERVKLYQASFTWDESWFQLEGYYRTGHYHWGYEGDFFNLYPEAYYQQAVDAFNADVPIGLVFSGKRALSGLKIAYGPEIYWGANPTVMAKWYRETGPWQYSFMHQEDIAQRASAPTSSALPIPQDRRSTFYLARRFGPMTLELGAIMAGSRRVGREFQYVVDTDESSGLGSYLETGQALVQDEIGYADTFGGKAKIKLELAPFYWYAQGGYRGLVADAGWDPTLTFTGWTLKESGQGNHWAVSTGAAVNVGDFQIAPNMLIQRPLIGPLPQIDDFFDNETGTYFPGTIARNQLADPFWVRSNRETYGFELLLTYDPTPATFMWAWDNVAREDAKFAFALDFTYRILPTIQDAGIGISAEGFVFGFPTSAPAQDLWDVSLQTINNFGNGWRLVNRIYAGNGQANGNDDRTITRYGTQGRLMQGRFAAEYFIKIDDWGPFDYYRDFNFTLPLQTMLDVSYSLAPQQFFAPSQTRFGIRTTFRTLDEFSERFLPNINDALGTEWEIRTYVQITI